MRNLLIVLLLCGAGWAQTLDKYGGNTAAPCSIAPPYANRFYVGKVGTSWRLCTPLQNSFFMQFVYDLEKYPTYGGDNFASIIAARYGSDVAAQAAEQKQLLHYGFNGAAPYSLKYFKATTPCSGCSLMPFAEMANSSGYSLSNSGNYATHPIKDVVKPTNKNYFTAYIGSSPDYGDAEYANYAMNSMSLDLYNMHEWYTNANNDYFVGWVLDETDTLNGFGGNDKDGFGTVDHAISYAGGQAVLGYIHLLTPPVQTAGNLSNVQLYASDTKSWMKDELVNWLQGTAESTSSVSVIGNGATATYTVGTHLYNVGDVLTVKLCGTFNTVAGVPVPITSITSTTVMVTQAVSGSASGCTVTAGPGHTVSSLNTAWGASYSAITSAGTTVTETICASSCSSTTYTGTLIHTLVAPHSVVVLVNNVAVAGDCPELSNQGCTASTGQGNWIGTGSGISSGSVTYATGAYSVTFAAAPVSSVKIQYTYGGWTNGNTVADEDGRHGWIPANGRTLSGATAGFISDLDNYTYYAAKRYFQQMRGVVNTLDPGRLYLGPTVIGTWCQPAHKNILKAAGQYVDLPQFANIPCGVSDDLARYNYSVANLGDRPFTIWMGFTAQDDSYWHTIKPHGAPNTDTADLDYATQALRGQGFYDRVNWMLNTADSTYGNTHYVGYQWWEWRDNSSESLNWGIVSLKANVYDGVEDKTATVACNPAVTGVTYLTSCGGETANYGDFTTKVTAANALWLGGVVTPPGGGGHARGIRCRGCKLR